ncbi:hypothetical protein SAMN05216289_1233 [Dokdonella immobilis]|uniref:Uncharacterized protein n=1 Tax=Dokdonella immobilis TaxID=578942 RepID=A0A1I4Z675_9GAMM|nr:hypothetical protein SAMN05216289_1233 [Dokdonella immobilis]
MTVRDLYGRIASSRFVRANLFKSKEQVEGLARVLDNLGTSAIVGATIIFFSRHKNICELLLFLFFAGGFGLVYCGFCLRKLLSSF